MQYLPGLESPYHYLTWFYSYSTWFVSWINQVLSIKEGGVSIFAVVCLVCLILYIIYHEKD